MSFMEQLDIITKENQQSTTNFKKKPQQFESNAYDDKIINEELYHEGSETSLHSQV